MKGSKKIIFNTVITYAKSVITIFISLYSTRLVLHELGDEDFGLFNLIGGVIAMLSFLNAAMTTSTQRFISFNLGKKNIYEVKKIFANSVIIHLIIGLIIFFGIELVANYLISNYLSINPERIEIS